MNDILNFEHHGYLENMEVGKRTFSKVESNQYQLFLDLYLNNK